MSSPRHELTMYVSSLQILGVPAGSITVLSVRAGSVILELLIAAEHDVLCSAEAPQGLVCAAASASCYTLCYDRSCGSPHDPHPHLVVGSLPWIRRSSAGSGARPLGWLPARGNARECSPSRAVPGQAFAGGARCFC